MSTINNSIAKQIIYPAKKATRWFGIDMHANLYHGCSNGCIYCESRNECIPNENFEHITFKSNTIEVLTNELSLKPKHQIVSIGSSTDPYNRMEASEQLTRQALEVIDACELGVVLTTKNDLIIRDIDLLKKIQSHSPVFVLITITTFNDQVAAKIEPSAPKPAERFKIVSRLTQEGIICGIKMMPIIPFINDTEQNIESIIKAAKNAGAKFIYPAFGISLRDRQRSYFFDMIEKEFPGLKNVFMDLFGSKVSCVSPNAPKLKKAFVIECKKQKLLYGMKEIVQLVKPSKTMQMKLF
ncbi:MAG: radical SAM protein [Candidatus Izemoplasmatales bacterium]|jgi:DNA repair photolyase|nr:radical SAM protein [Candidatus Izemoplasmatales bacterium]MDD3864797.1 radical SAM protein [Candidatus Izemoplasmatales bacterium]